MLAGDPWLTHSMLPASLNLGLADPLPLNSVEGFVRQVMGWRYGIRHLYRQLGRECRHGNALAAHEEVPDWRGELDAAAVDADCLSHVLADVRERSWVHHIPCLMVLGNHALQRGIDPLAMTDWFNRLFVDGNDGVMGATVVGMGQHGDGGVLGRAVRRGRRLHRPDERLLRRLPLPPEEAAGGGRLPVRRRLLGLPGAQWGAAGRQPADAPAAVRAGPVRGPRCGRGPGGPARHRRP
jgi:hypothetical protein